MLHVYRAQIKLCPEGPFGLGGGGDIPLGDTCMACLHLGIIHVQPV